MRPHPFRRGNRTDGMTTERRKNGFNEAPPFQAGKLAAKLLSHIPERGFNEAPPFQAGKRQSTTRAAQWK